MTDFDPDWPHGHVTRDGKRAELQPRRLNGQSTYPRFAIITDRDGTEYLQFFTDEGRSLPSKNQDANDLLNAPAPKRVWEGWAVWSIDTFAPHPIIGTDEAWAREYNKRNGGLIAPVRIEFPEG